MFLKRIKSLNYSHVIFSWPEFSHSNQDSLMERVHKNMSHKTLSQVKKYIYYYCNFLLAVNAALGASAALFKHFHSI